MRAVLDGLEGCTPELVTAVVDDVLRRTDDGCVRPPARWRELTRAAVLRADAAAAEHRRRAAVRDRHVHVQPAADGMAWVRALLPAEDALRVGAALDQRAHDLRSQGDDRTSAQLHADVLVADLTGTPAAHGSPGDVASRHRTAGGAAAGGRSRARRGLVADVHIPAAVLTGSSTEPAVLRGHGPISATHAHDLLRAPGTVLRALFVDPATGEPLAHGRTWTVSTDTRARHLARELLASSATVLAPEPGYAPSTALATLCLARDTRSLFPTSSVPSWRCDLDHRRPHHHGGTTSPANTGPLDRGAHRLKQKGLTWTRLRDGRIRWRAPGRPAVHRPATWAPPPPLVSCRA